MKLAFNLQEAGFTATELKTAAEIVFEDGTIVASNLTLTAKIDGISKDKFDELVKDAESWISISFMRTKENLNNDFYYDYKNASGQIINSTTIDRVVTDSIKNEVGYVRRPTDRLITVGLYLEDYLT